jgi:hypothetical protein
MVRPIPCRECLRADLLTVRLYLLNLDQETLEVYEFKDYSPHRFSPFARLTTKRLYQESPNAPPGYYIKLKLSELQAMWRSDWVEVHEDHAKALDKLWRQNALALRTIPHADNIPFAVLYGSVFYGKEGNGTHTRRSRRLTQARLEEVMAVLSRRHPSKMSIFERQPMSPRTSANRRLQVTQDRVFGLRRDKTEQQRRRSRRS